MTNRDFDQDDARELAEFAGLNDGGSHYWNEKRECYKQSWKPWLLEAPMWQIHFLKDAVREKGLVAEYEKKLSDVVEFPDKPGGFNSPQGPSDREAYQYELNCDFALHSAPPEAICLAILSMEGE